MMRWLIPRVTHVTPYHMDSQQPRPRSQPGEGRRVPGLSASPRPGPLLGSGRARGSGPETRRLRVRLRPRGLRTRVQGYPCVRTSPASGVRLPASGETPRLPAPGAGQGPHWRPRLLRRSPPAQGCT